MGSSSSAKSINIAGFVEGLTIKLDNYIGNYKNDVPTSIKKELADYSNSISNGISGTDTVTQLAGDNKNIVLDEYGQVVGYGNAAVTVITITNETAILSSSNATRAAVNGAVSIKQVAGLGAGGQVMAATRMLASAGGGALNIIGAVPGLADSYYNGTPVKVVDAVNVTVGGASVLVTVIGAVGGVAAATAAAPLMAVLTIGGAVVVIGLDLINPDYNLNDLGSDLSKFFNDPKSIENLKALIEPAVTYEQIIAKNVALLNSNLYTNEERLLLKQSGLDKFINTTDKVLQTDQVLSLVELSKGLLTISPDDFAIANIYGFNNALVSYLNKNITSLSSDIISNNVLNAINSAVSVFKNIPQSEANFLLENPDFMSYFSKTIFDKAFNSENIDIEQLFKELHNLFNCNKGDDYLYKMVENSYTITQLNKYNSDPIVLKIDEKNSILSDQTGYFDLNADGFKERISWASKSNGVLCFDSNGDGSINNGTEIFSNSFLLPGSEGFKDSISSLIAVDSNNDGIIDHSDLSFANIKVWIDSNGDFLSNKQELFSLSELNINSINLNRLQNSLNLTGGASSESISFITDGSSITGYQFDLNYSKHDTVSTGIKIINKDILDLPQLHGTGTVRDLHSAMQLNQDLFFKVSEAYYSKPDVVFNSFKDIASLWVNPDNELLSSRGFASGLTMKIIESFAGQKYTPDVNSTDWIGAKSAEVFNSLASDIVIEKASQFIMQTYFKDLIQNSFKNDLSEGAYINFANNVIKEIVQCNISAAESNALYYSLAKYISHPLSAMSVADIIASIDMTSKGFDYFLLGLSSTINVTNFKDGGADFYQKSLDYVSQNAEPYPINDITILGHTTSVVDQDLSNHSYPSSSHVVLVKDEYISDNQDLYLNSGYNQIILVGNTNKTINIIPTKDSVLDLTFLGNNASNTEGHFNSVDQSLTISLGGASFKFSSATDVSFLNEILLSNGTVIAKEDFISNTVGLSDYLVNPLAPNSNYSSTTGNDTYIDPYGYHYVELGKGNDKMIGGFSDTYHFNIGDGQDVISKFENIQIDFGDNINPGDIKYYKSGNDLLLKVGSLNDSILLKDAFSYDLFTELSSSQIFMSFNNVQRTNISNLIDTIYQVGSDVIIGVKEYKNWIQGSNHDDIITTGDRYDSVWADKGDDTVLMGQGSLVYNYSKGDGIDTLYSPGNKNGSLVIDKTILFDSNIKPEDVTIYKQNGSLIIQSGTSDAIVVKNFYTVSYDSDGRPFADASTVSSIDYVKFSDGTIYDKQALLIFTERGSANSDIMCATSTGINNMDISGGHDIVYTGASGSTNNLSIGSGGSTIYSFGGDNNFTIHKGLSNSVTTFKYASAEMSYSYLLIKPEGDMGYDPQNKAYTLEKVTPNKVQGKNTITLGSDIHKDMVSIYREGSDLVILNRENNQKFVVEGFTDQYGRLSGNNPIWDKGLGYFHDQIAEPLKVDFIKFSDGTILDFNDLKYAPVVLDKNETAYTSVDYTNYDSLPLTPSIVSTYDNFKEFHQLLIAGEYSILVSSRLSPMYADTSNISSATIYSYNSKDIVFVSNAVKDLNITLSRTESITIKLDEGISIKNFIPYVKYDVSPFNVYLSSNDFSVGKFELSNGGIIKLDRGVFFNVNRDALTDYNGHFSWDGVNIVDSNGISSHIHYNETDSTFSFIEDKYITSENSPMNIITGSGNDIVESSKYDDYFNLGSGHNIVKYSLGDGSDIIVNADIKFDSSITSDMLTYTQDVHHIEHIRIKGTNDVLTVIGANTYGLDFEEVNGVVILPDNDVNMVNLKDGKIYQTAGSTSFYIGDSGFNSTILVTDNSHTNLCLSIDNISNISISRVGNDLEISNNITNQYLLFKDVYIVNNKNVSIDIQFSGTLYGINLLSFDSEGNNQHSTDFVNLDKINVYNFTTTKDNLFITSAHDSVITIDNLSTNYIVTKSGDDVINILDGSINQDSFSEKSINYIDTSSGNDSVNLSLKNTNTIVYSLETNNEIVSAKRDNVNDKPIDILLGSGLTVNDIKLEVSGIDLIISNSVTNGTLLIKDYNNGYSYATNFVTDSKGGSISVEQLFRTDTYIDSDIAPTSYTAGANERLEFHSSESSTYIKGSLFDDYLYGGSGDDTLIGMGGQNIMDGGAGNDTLISTSGKDILFGGQGDDTYYVNQKFISSEWGSPIKENADEGFDTVYTTFDYTLDSNIEELISKADSSLVLGGNDLNNVIVGDNFGDHIDGAYGDDIINSGSGSDVITVGHGNDIVTDRGGNNLYIIDNPDNGATTIIDSLGIGESTLSFRILWEDTPDNYHFTQDVNNLNIFNKTTNSTVIIKDYYNSLSNIKYVSFDYSYDYIDTPVKYLIDSFLIQTDYKYGTIGSDKLIELSNRKAFFYGYEGNDTLTGGKYDDYLNGGSGNDIITGGLGNNTLLGGLGNDSYIVSNSADTIIENLNEGTDIVKASVDFKLTDNIENLTLTASNLVGEGNDLNNTIIATLGDNTLIGNGGNDTLTSGVGSDTMIGGIGNDTYNVNSEGDVVIENLNEGTDTVKSTINYTLGSSLENLTLLGSADLIALGNELNNVLTSNTGINTLIGGLGNDTYVLNNSLDTVIENANEGTDTVKASFDYTLGANLENLTLTGTGDFNGTGNELNNVITGNAGNNTLYGLDGNDTLTGGAGNDNLYGGNGNDSLNGGAGVNLLVGGDGNDTYTVTSSDDTVVENFNEGTDLVKASISYTLGQNVENLTLTGTTGGLVGTGNELDNTLTTSAAGDSLYGLAGNDKLTGGNGNDTLDGGLGNDTLSSGAGNDVLRGGLGNDSLTGGTGSDTYIFGLGDGQDTINNTTIDTTPGKMDQLVFENINADQLWLQKSGNNLVISVLNTTDKVTVTNWFTSANNHLQDIVSGDGLHLSESQVDQMLQLTGTNVKPADGHITGPALDIWHQ